MLHCFRTGSSIPPPNGIILELGGRLGVHSTSSPGSSSKVMMINPRTNLSFGGRRVRLSLHGPGTHKALDDNLRSQGGLRTWVTLTASSTSLKVRKDKMNSSFCTRMARWYGAGLYFQVMTCNLSEHILKPSPAHCRSRSGNQKVFADLWHAHTGVTDRASPLSTDHSSLVHPYPSSKTLFKVRLEQNNLINLGALAAALALSSYGQWAWNRCVAQCAFPHPCFFRAQRLNLNFWVAFHSRQTPGFTHWVDLYRHLHIFWELFFKCWECQGVCSSKSDMKNDI